VAYAYKQELKVKVGTWSEATTVKMQVCQLQAKDQLFDNNLVKAMPRHTYF
jgi:hypothetical protein